METVLVADASSIARVCSKFGELSIRRQDADDTKIVRDEGNLRSVEYKPAAKLRNCCIRQ